MSTRWDPAQYLRFGDQRLRPAIELMQRVQLERAERICDLGCGTGHITRLLAQRWPNARVHGIDNSSQMLAKARAEPSDIDWVEADLREWRPEQPPDLLFSNAVLHWVAGHDELLPRLAGMVRDGGALAVQMPRNWSAPSHRLMRETLANGGSSGGRDAPLGTEELRAAVGRKWVLEPDEYFVLLRPHVASLDIWETEYLQVLQGEDPVLEWVRGTGLRPVLEGLGDADRDRFLEAYAAALRTAYPQRADGSTLFPFKRLFIVATRAG